MFLGRHHTLIHAIGKGDRKAFRTLYDLFSEQVFNLALSYVHNRKDAEEVTQDVFVSVHRNAARFRGEAAVSTWIYRIAINKALNRIEKNKRTPSFQADATDEAWPIFDHPGVVLENKERAAYLFRAIHALPEKQKTAFILGFVEDLPRQEIADVMELSLKAVESLLQRAKANLRKKLEKMYPHRRK